MAVNTIIEVEMTDGSIQKMTLNFKNLYLLRNKDKKTYDEYMRISNKGAKDEIEVAEMLYAAYRCANIDKECMSLEDFLEILPVDRDEITEIVLKLQAKKNGFRRSIQKTNKSEKRQDKTSRTSS